MKNLESLRKCKDTIILFETELYNALPTQSKIIPKQYWIKIKKIKNIVFYVAGFLFFYYPSKEN